MVGNETHPGALVTVKVYEPVAKPEIVAVVPDPVIPPGLIVQPLEGNPPNTTLPVATLHVGCIIEITFGIGGVPGFAIIIILADREDVHPAEFVTV